MCEPVSVSSAVPTPVDAPATTWPKTGAEPSPQSIASVYDPACPVSMPSVNDPCAVAVAWIEGIMLKVGGVALPPLNSTGPGPPGSTTGIGAVPSKTVTGTSAV